MLLPLQSWAPRPLPDGVPFSFQREQDLSAVGRRVQGRDKANETAALLSLSVRELQLREWYCVIDWRRFRLMAIDMDGTMAGADHRVTARTVELLGEAERDGLRTVVITGRTYPSPLAVWHQAKLSAPLILMGGALTVQPPDLTVVRSAPIPVQLVAKALKLGEAFDLSVCLCTQRGYWVTRSSAWADLLSAINDTPCPVVAPGPEAPYPFGPVPVLKLMWGGPTAPEDSVAAELVAQMAPLDVARSLPEFIEATMPEASKHGALKALLDDLGVDPAELIAIGDGETDVGMLSMAGYAAVPVNGMPAAKAVAHQIIGHHDREGVADFVAEVLRQRHAQ